MPMKRFLNEELQVLDPGSARRVVLQLSEAEERDKEEAFRVRASVCLCVGGGEVAFKAKTAEQG